MKTTIIKLVNCGIGGAFAEELNTTEGFGSDVTTRKDIAEALREIATEIEKGCIEGIAVPDSLKVFTWQVGLRDAVHIEKKEAVNA